MAEVEDITQEEADGLSPGDPGRLSVKQMKALLSSKNVTVAGIVEKSELQRLIREKTSRTDVEQFLIQEARPKPTPPPTSSGQRRSTTPAASTTTGADGLTPQLRQFKVQLEQQISAIRNGPSKFRDAVPPGIPFKTWSDDQLLAYANTCEQMTKDPVLLKRGYDQTYGGGQGGAGGQLSSFVNQTNEELKAWIARMKANPADLKAQLVTLGRQFNVDEAKVNTFVQGFQAARPDTIFLWLRMARGIAYIASKVQLVYDKVNTLTGGNGKIVAAILALVFAYTFYLYLAGPMWYAGTFFPKLVLRCVRVRRFAELFCMVVV